MMRRITLLFYNFPFHRLYGESMFQETKPELYQDFTILKGLEPERAYKMSVVAVDGEFTTESDIEEIDTHETGIVSTTENISTI